MELLDTKLDHATLLNRELAGGKSMGEALAALADATGNAHEQLLSQGGEWPLGWLELPQGGPWAVDCQQLADRLRTDFSELIVCGTGGSALGLQAIYAALDHPNAPLRTVRVLDNVDPTQALHLAHDLDLDSCAINVVSKSGKTLETMAGFFHLLSLLGVAQAGAAPALPSRIVATTGADKSTLRSMAEEGGWATLPIPEDVGGRYSALSPAALMPLAFAGVDIDALLDLFGERQGKAVIKLEPAMLVEVPARTLHERPRQTAHLQPQIAQRPLFGVGQTQPLILE
ncbi:hypothetical protein IIA79_07505 [bacterium]|nr:hypothetical protein [bacterium]